MQRRLFNDAIKRFLLEHVPDGSRVLDVGCGTGLTALYLARQKAGCVVEGIDIDTARIHRANTQFLKAKRDHVVHCYACSVETLTQHLGRARYDVVVSTHSFHHYQQPLAALRQIRAILKPAGCLLLAELEPRYGEQVDNCPRYSLTKIVALLEQARFQVRQASHHQPGVLLLRAERKKHTVTTTSRSLHSW